jgi:hypothetical protein
MCASLHSNVMSEADFARYLQQAETCLNEARKATRKVDKEAWLELAEDWMVMATKAQRTLSAKGSRKRQDRD